MGNVQAPLNKSSREDLRFQNMKQGELTRKSFSYKGANVWNDIPNNIRNVESVALSKSRLETILWANKTSKILPQHDLQEEHRDVRFIFCLNKL